VNSPRQGGTPPTGGHAKTGLTGGRGISEQRLALRDGYPVHDEDVARLSPLGFKHIHFLGRYAFTLSEPGQVRPLRDPASADDDEDEE